jgi:membrane-bound serine protease (ClpP class)
LAAFVGKHGVAATTLRPVGFVRVEGARLDAVAESGFIEAGRAVRVLEALEGQLKVREEPARSD